MSLERSKSYEKGKRKQLARLIRERTKEDFLDIMKRVREMNIDDVIIAVEEEYHLINGHRGYVVTEAPKEKTDE